MKTKLTLSALLIAALPLAAQADNAAERALQLHQESLSTLSQQAPSAAHAVEANQIQGGSAAMQQARAALLNHSTETRFTASDDSLAPAKEATT
ncbi:hypothetical protein ACGTN6_10590 [Halomonas sp. THAF12]|uniref:hypothetical protein n=1 Tax=Halomonas sp. B23F22_10 TaxID=3459515 RepID=UPI00373EB890